MRKNLLLSISLHVVLAAFLYLFSEGNLDGQNVPIQIEILPAAVQKSAVHSASPGTGAAKKKVTRTEAAIVRSLFGSGYVADSKVLGDHQKHHSENTFADGRTYITGADNFISDTDQWSYFEQVFKKIDEQLIFDSILAQYDHFGIVYVEFEVDEQGRFVKNRLKVSAEDAILKVHALRALIKGLQESFDKTKWNTTGTSHVFQAQFVYLQDSPSINQNKQKAFGKSVLTFTRATNEKPIPSTIKEQLLTGGVHYELFSVAERWQKYNKKKKLREQGFDPFSTYKSDPLYTL
ncbi:hypothetical protein ACLVWU_18220 [Bdellovibrio sp. HCB290]|uniref:hypothetical protein n=1 Tax=Bdellovibrio sp. HCB290 TaxID=3394356 RepID=UPI0039B5A7F0